MQILLCFESQKTNCTEYSSFAVYNLRFSVLSCTRLKPYGWGSVRVLLMLWKYLLWPLLSSYPTEKKNIRVHCSLVLIFLNDIKTIISLWQNFTRHDETDAAFRPVSYPMPACKKNSTFPCERHCKWLCKAVLFSQIMFFVNWPTLQDILLNWEPEFSSSGLLTYMFKSVSFLGSVLKIELYHFLLTASIKSYHALLYIF